MRKPVYKRILLKLSGEALKGKRGFGIDFEQTAIIAEQINEIHALGIEIAIVIGGEIYLEECLQAKTEWIELRPIIWE